MKREGSGELNHRLIPALLIIALLVGCGSAASVEESPPATQPAPAASSQTAVPPAATVTENTARPALPSPELTPNFTREGGDSPAKAATSPPPSLPPETATPGNGATPVPADTVVGTEPDWARELREAGLHTGIWETDFSKHAVPYNEIFSGGVPRDGIPPIDDPRFVTVAAADAWLEEKEPVIAFELEGEARAYPLQILTYHEIVNDRVAGTPVAVTFCPLCNSALVFDRRLDGEVYDFGVSGNLRNSDLIMWDRQTQSWWQQLTGEAIVGQLTGKQLRILPAVIAAWQDFRGAYPEGLVLSRDTGHRRNYGSNPYAGYDEVGQSPFLFFGKEDARLLPMERVAALDFDGESLAFPFAFLKSVGVAHYSGTGRELVVFFRAGARSALDRRSIADSREAGATGIFLREVAGQTLTFQPDGEDFIDQETGTRWDIFGRALEGPYAGKQLTPVVHANHFWFAWAAFRPDTKVVSETAP